MEVMMTLEYQLKDHRSSRHMVNFLNNTENEYDYKIGWEWHKVDSGQFIAPYNGAMHYLKTECT